MKAAVGYAAVIALFLAAVWLIVGVLDSLTRSDGAERTINNRQRATNDVVSQLYQAEVIGQALSAGQTDLFQSYVDAMMLTAQAVDSLRAIVNDRAQVARLDSVKMLLGRKVEIYKPLKYETVVSKAKKRVYKMEIPEGNYIAYGNIPWNSLFNAKLNVNGIYRTGYARWLSPSVFNIPVNEDRDYYKVVLHSKQKLDLDDGAEQFYVLDLDLLKSIAEELEKNTPDVMDIENGSAEFVVNAKEGQSLFTSIPYCDGWTVKVNGQKVQPDKVVDSLYLLRVRMLLR